MKGIERFEDYGVTELTNVQMKNFNGGGFLRDAVSFVGECIGTAIGGVICAFKCLSNHLGATQAK
ncbi:hypothetical protein ACO2Q8_06685 [Larkinella sp. VNQ87]|uniref:hypothetical protein n=1 Tax=Larkinella sp. VNQ87 TaxID=3400921 RepID=UPI003C0F07AE